MRKQIQLMKELSKSGIVTLVLISVLAGYAIGHPFERPFEWGRMIWTLIGILFLASGSSALNQVQERKLDAQMPRTAKRPLPSGRLSLQAAILFVILSLSLGLTILYSISQAVFALGIFAVVLYNGLYTMWWKKHWAFAAVPGAVPGALPILMGHVAATGQLFHPGGLYLFFILFFWQMPHFWTLAIRYQEDYAQAGFPILPVKHGPQETLKNIVIWCLAYLALALMAPLFLPVTSIYLSLTLFITVTILWQLYKYMKHPEGKAWLHFFLWVNLSLILFLAAAALDLWSVYLRRV